MNNKTYRHPTIASAIQHHVFDLRRHHTHNIAVGTCRLTQEKRAGWSCGEACVRLLSSNASVIVRQRSQIKIAYNTINVEKTKTFFSTTHDVEIACRQFDSGYRQSDCDVMRVRRFLQRRPLCPHNSRGTSNDRVCPAFVARFLVDSHLLFPF